MQTNDSAESPMRDISYILQLPYSDDVAILMPLLTYHIHPDSYNFVNLLQTYLYSTIVFYFTLYQQCN